VASRVFFQALALCCGLKGALENLRIGIGDGSNLGRGNLAPGTIFPRSFCNRGIHFVARKRDTVSPGFFPVARHRG
jgi:hypothetical protein